MTSTPSNNQKALEQVLNYVIPSWRDKEGNGYDVYSRLLKDRVIVVEGGVDGAMAANIIAQLLILDNEDSSKPIQMIINSPGGSVYDGLAIFDAMRKISSPIHTIGVGMQASMGSILLAGGDERSVTKNAEVLVHQVSGGANGQSTEVEVSASSMAHLYEKLKNIYVEFTGLNHSYWDVVGERDTWITAEDALKIGFITEIIEPFSGNEKISTKTLGKYAAESKRPLELQNIFNNVAKIQIAEMNSNEILKYVNNGSANSAQWARYRPELVVKLAEFPEFWVDLKKQEYMDDHGGKLPSNDDKKPATNELKAFVQKWAAKI